MGQEFLMLGTPTLEGALMVELARQGTQLLLPCSVGLLRRTSGPQHPVMSHSSSCPTVYCVWKASQ